MFEQRFRRWVVVAALAALPVIAATGRAARAADGAVAAPVFSVPTGTYANSVWITVSCPTPGARLVVTTDGSDPDESGPDYGGEPIPAVRQVSAGHDPDPADSVSPLTSVSLTLRARAFARGLAPSDVVTAAYVIDSIETAFNVAYAPPPAVGGLKHTLDVYRPRACTACPVLVFVHGGAWESGDKDLYFEFGCTLAGDYGFVVAVLNYELSAPPWNAVHPDHIRDVARGFAWVVENIDSFGGDPGRIVVVGHSAGAHLASLLAADPTWLLEVGLSTESIRGVIAISGLYDLPAFVTYPSNPLGLGLLPVLTYRSLFTTVFGGADTAGLAAASPALLIQAGAPPFEVVFANGDLAGLGPDALRFAAVLEQLGIPVTLVALSAADIPPGVPVTLLGEHGEEIMAVNTRDFDSRPARAVADFARRVTAATSHRGIPDPRPGQPYPQPLPPSAALTAR